MDYHHEEACESVDASVFSGDLLYTSLAEFKEYLGRWNRAVAEYERLEVEESPAPIRKCPQCDNWYHPHENHDFKNCSSLNP